MITAVYVLESWWQVMMWVVYLVGFVFVVWLCIMAFVWAIMWIDEFCSKVYRCLSVCDDDNDSTYKCRGNKRRM